MILQGDCIEVLKSMEDNSVDAVITDPPYELGFMGKAWDGTGIAYNVDVWRECLRVLKPGGHSKAIDKAAGAKREVVGTRKAPGMAKTNVVQGAQNRSKYEFQETGKVPATPEAQQWEGWGTALKPSHEPIVLARKPFAGTVADNVLAWGTGGINVDGCRVETDDFKNMDSETFSSVKKGTGTWNASDKGMFDEGRRGGWINGPPSGRFPANFMPRESEEKKHATKLHNFHPTVKPTDLMRYLCRLITPPAGIVLDPFAGSGSTGKAAALEGFDFIGIELEEEYCRIARKRVEQAKANFVDNENKL